MNVTHSSVGPRRLASLATPMHGTRHDVAVNRVRGLDTPVPKPAANVSDGDFRSVEHDRREQVPQALRHEAVRQLSTRRHVQAGYVVGVADAEQFTGSVLGKVGLDKRHQPGRVGTSR